MVFPHHLFVVGGSRTLLYDPYFLRLLAADHRYSTTTLRCLHYCHFPSYLVDLNRENMIQHAPIFTNLSALFYILFVHHLAILSTVCYLYALRRENVIGLGSHKRCRFGRSLLDPLFHTILYPGFFR